MWNDFRRYGVRGSAQDPFNFDADTDLGSAFRTE